MPWATSLALKNTRDLAAQSVPYILSCATRSVGHAAHNVAASSWGELFTRDDALLCVIDRVFGRASFLVMLSAKHRSRGLDIHSVAAVPPATKARGMQPKEV